MTRAERLASLLALGVSFLPVSALAGEVETGARSTVPDIDTEHIFGFAEGSDIGSKGEREIESVTVGSFGAIGNYNNVDNETSFRYSVTDNLRLSIGTLTDYYNIHGAQGLSDRSSVSFSGLITELRWKIVDRLTQPFGMTLSINPQWRQFDPTSGERSGNYAIPVALLIDKEVIPSKLFAALNLIYTPSFLRVNGARGHDDSFAVIAAGSYAIMPNIFIGAEIRHENLAENGTLDAHALFVGPSLFYRFTEAFSVKVAWAAQIPDIGATSLNLTSYQRQQVEFQFAYTF